MYDYTKELQTFSAFYGLDEHKETISIGRCLPWQEPEYITTIENEESVIRNFFAKELETYPNILTSYEAGGGGYYLDRLLRSIDGVNNVYLCVQNKNSKDELTNP